MKTKEMLAHVIDTHEDLDEARYDLEECQKTLALALGKVKLFEQLQTAVQDLLWDVDKKGNYFNPALNSQKLKTKKELHEALTNLAVAWSDISVDIRGPLEPYTVHMIPHVSINPPVITTSGTIETKRWTGDTTTS